ncbi:MAG: hypothetical protein ACE10J_09285, partial [Thermodesulfobacteriota bacterium]
ATMRIWAADELHEAVPGGPEPVGDCGHGRVRGPGLGGRPGAGRGCSRHSGRAIFRGINGNSKQENTGSGAWENRHGFC